MKWKHLAYQFILYTGSWVKKQSYQPFIDMMAGRNMTIQFTSSSDRHEKKILIGHSLGGFFALRDSLKAPEDVEAVILIHSHFNSRFKMPYPVIKQSSVSVPVLTILAGRDERLPFDRSVDDLLERGQESYPDKVYSIFPNHTHFSGVVDPDGRKELVDVIESFVRCLPLSNFSSLHNRIRYFDSGIRSMTLNPVITSNSMSLLDALFRFTMPSCIWNHLHWCWFLSSKPGFLHFLFEDSNHIFMKGSPTDMDRIRSVYSSWLEENSIDITFHRLPSIHPSILLWIGLPLFLSKRYDKIHVPVLYLPINENITYYKIPHPHSIFRMFRPDQYLSSDEM